MARQPKKPNNGRVSQAQAGKMLGIDPALITRTWKPRFEDNGWPGFYTDGVDLTEFHQGILRWERMKAKSELDSLGDGDAKEMYDRARAEKAQLELQQMRGQMIFVPDFIDELARIQSEYRNASSRIPRTMAPNLIAHIGSLLADDMKRNPDISKAISKIKQNEIEIWLDERIKASLGDMGKQLDKAWRNAIERAKIRAGS